MRTLRPRSPEGVRLVDPDGKDWPCAMAFTHTDEDGINHWLATPTGLTRDAVKTKGLDAKWQMLIDLLPAGCAISVGWPHR